MLGKDMRPKKQICSDAPSNAVVQVAATEVRFGNLKDGIRDLCFPKAPFVPFLGLLVLGLLVFSSGSSLLAEE